MLTLGLSSSLFEAQAAGRGDWQLEIFHIEWCGNGLGLRQIDWEQGTLSGESPSDESVCVLRILCCSCGYVWHNQWVSVVEIARAIPQPSPQTVSAVKLECLITAK